MYLENILQGCTLIQLGIFEYFNLSKVHLKTTYKFYENYPLSNDGSPFNLNINLLT